MQPSPFFFHYSLGCSLRVEGQKKKKKEKTMTVGLTAISSSSELTQLQSMIALYGLDGNVICRLHCNNIFSRMNFESGGCIVRKATSSYRKQFFTLCVM